MEIRAACERSGSESITHARRSQTKAISDYRLRVLMDLEPALSEIARQAIVNGATYRSAILDAFEELFDQIGVIIVNHADSLKS